MTLNEELKNIMTDKELDQETVSEYTGYSLDSVKAWCANPDTGRYREMKPRAMKLLKLELKDRKIA